ncbi:hypothetical protein E2C01_041219 [Portunus trituberculatus]|uniref:Uncharacterized protein n=1 Tax=Portunus trituberculatus TaxID=210409 RepID=A0A5B7FJF9_PORTR|nr:hypothetical protein [Portunus trituberculatus]
MHLFTHYYKLHKNNLLKNILTFLPLPPSVQLGRAPRRAGGTWLGERQHPQQHQQWSVWLSWLCVHHPLLPPAPPCPDTLPPVCPANTTTTTTTSGSSSRSQEERGVREEEEENHYGIRVTPTPVSVLSGVRLRWRTGTCRHKTYPLKRR